MLLRTTTCGHGLRYKGRNISGSRRGRLLRRREDERLRNASTTASQELSSYLLFHTGVSFPGCRKRLSGVSRVVVPIPANSYNFGGHPDCSQTTREPPCQASL